jgi:hypothetical protein
VEGDYGIAFSLFLLFRNKIVLAMKTRGESGGKAPFHSEALQQLEVSST